MKKLVSILILILFFSANCLAQWHVIYPNERYNYLLSNQSDSIIRTTIWVDSSGIENGDSVYYLNKICVKNGSVIGPFGSNTILQINQSQFLKSRITFNANNTQHIEGDVNWYVNGNCNQGDSWVFDSTANITAICDSVYLSSFFGVSDSVKRIVVDANDTMLLSKNHGVIFFPGLDSLNQSYILVGLEVQHLGLTVPKAYDFLNFNIGDEFEYQVGASSTFSGSNPHTSYWTGYKRYLILSKSFYPDSVIYEIKEKFRIENHPFGGPNTIQIDTGIVDTLVYYLSFPDDFLNEGFNWNYSYQPGLISWTEIKTDTMGAGYSKQYHKYNCDTWGLDGLILGATNPVSYNYYVNARYSESFGLLSQSEYSGTGGFGGTSSGSYQNLIACTVNGNQLGQYLPDSTYHACSLDPINASYIISDKDTLIDADTTAILCSSYLGSSYLWSTGEVSDTIIIHDGGVYTLTVTNSYGCSKICSKSIFRICNNYIVSDKDTLIDADTTAILRSSIQATSYLWSTGETGDTIVVHQEGIYTLTTTNAFGCSSYSAKHIFSNHNVYTNYITTSTLFICDSSEAVLSSIKNGFHYLWSTGSTNSSIKVNAPGTYYLTTTDDLGFTSVKSVAIVNTETTPFGWPVDTVIALNSNIVLQLPAMYDLFLWNDGDVTSEKTFSPYNLLIGKNTIWASATKNECTVSDTIIIFRSPDENSIEENFYQFFTIENGELYLLPTAYDYTYEIYSTEGKRLTKGNYTSGSRIQPFIVKSVNSGIYLLRITTHQDSYTGKIFIRH